MHGVGPAAGDDRPLAHRVAIGVGRFLWDVVVGVSIILLIVVVLFALSGVWPPFVAIESGSMEPHMSEGDLVFLVDADRYTTYDGIQDTELVTLEAGGEIGHLSFGKPGHVIVFSEEGKDYSVIHRIHFWVEEGEDWTERANPEYLSGVSECARISNCPAPHDGFITKGDANSMYDQVSQDVEIIKPEWIEGRAAIRIPFLGHLRLSL